MSSNSFPFKESKSDVLDPDLRIRLVYPYGLSTEELEKLPIPTGFSGIAYDKTVKKIKFYIDGDWVVSGSGGSGGNQYTVRAGSTANVDISTLKVGSVIDGITLALNDNVLLKDNTDQTQNGYYQIGTEAPAERSGFANSGDEIANSVVVVTAGTVNADKTFRCTDDTITIGTTDIVFTSGGSLVTHNQLSGLQGGDTDEFYHLSSVPHGHLSNLDQSLATTDDVTFGKISGKSGAVLGENGQSGTANLNLGYNNGLVQLGFQREGATDGYAHGGIAIDTAGNLNYSFGSGGKKCFYRMNQGQHVFQTFTNGANKDLFIVDYTGATVITANNTAPSDALMSIDGSIAPYLDENANELHFKAKYSDGTTFKDVAIPFSSQSKAFNYTADNYVANNEDDSFTMTVTPAEHGLPASPHMSVTQHNLIPDSSPATYQVGFGADYKTDEDGNIYVTSNNPGSGFLTITKHEVI